MRAITMTPATALIAMALFASRGSAKDATCTAERLSEQRDALNLFLQNHPDQQHGVVQIIAEVESEYGGEPPDNKRCEVMAKVLGVLTGKPVIHKGGS